MAASAWGVPIGTWRATLNGLEGVCATANDGLLSLDELSEADPNAAGDAAYMLANGSGKARASRDGTARERLQHRLAFISTREVRLGDKLREDGRPRANRAGQGVRLIEVPADAEAGMGIFEALHDRPSAGALAAELSKACQARQGTRLRPFWSTSSP